MASMAAVLVEEERLDAIDPLRHLSGASMDTADDVDGDADPLGQHESDVLLPAQRISTTNQIITLSFPPEDLQVQLNVDAGPGCGGIAWPAGEVLARYLCSRQQSNPGWIDGKEVLELGAGTGLVGLVAGKLGANVVCSDQRQLLDLIERNITLNHLSSSVQAVELNWGEPLPTQLDLSCLSLVLAADCVYFEPAFPLLVQTLCDLADSALQGRDVLEILFCYKKRRKADKRFFALLKKHFEWHDVEDDRYKHLYAREAISLLRLMRRPKP